MAIISFWNADKKSAAQTLSMVAIATNMAIEHNYKILVVDATFQDDTIERCFWRFNNNKSPNQFLNNTGKIDIASGAEGLVSAVASNKATPEIIPNYTKVVLKNRLDILCGLKTEIPEEFEKSLMLYKDLLQAANKYYDLVFVDLTKTLKKDTTKALLECSHVIVYPFLQNLKQIDSYLEKKKNVDIMKKGNMIPLMTNVDQDSKYNVKNATRYMGEKKELANILHNSNFMESACEASVANFFLKAKLSTTALDKNAEFLKSVNGACKKIIQKLEELKYKT